MNQSCKYNKEKVKKVSLNKKDIQELLNILLLQLEHGHYSGGCSTTETDYLIEYRIFKKWTVNTITTKWSVDYALKRSLVLLVKPVVNVNKYLQQADRPKAVETVYVNAMKTIKKLLGYLGLGLFCSKCGSNLIFYRERGFYEEKIYICPKCDVV